MQMDLKYNIPSNENIYDSLIKISVPFENIVSMLFNNGYNLDTNFFDTKGQILYSSDDVEAPKGGQPSVVATQDNLTYKTNSTQNIYDVGLMTTADLNNIVSIIFYNSAYFTSINSAIDGIFVINYKASDISNNAMKKSFTKGNINITTGDQIRGAILQETSYYLLQENRGLLILN